MRVFSGISLTLVDPSVARVGGPQLKDAEKNMEVEEIKKEVEDEPTAFWMEGRRPTSGLQPLPTMVIRGQPLQTFQTMTFIQTDGPGLPLKKFKSQSH